jgi:muramoyltetrapeptide carboxypeptidase
MTSNQPHLWYNTLFHKLTLYWEPLFYMDVRTIRIIKASSPDREGLLGGRIAELERAGFRILFDEIQPNSSWTWTAGSVHDRARALNSALTETGSDAVMWARGGYGASELLDLVDWAAVRNSKAKPIIGFSDVCAAQSALYTLTGRISIHGPMPATTTWAKAGPEEINELTEILNGKKREGQLPVTCVGSSASGLSGKLFGGCLSVLTSLIGTKYFPPTLAGHILYFEDIGENPGRIIRMMNQWAQSGNFKGVTAIVLGSFTGLGGQLTDNAPVLLDEIYARYHIPTFNCPLFGHSSPNLPLVLGAKAGIHNNLLSWSLD